MSNADTPPEATPEKNPRIAKYLARAGVASRRDAERMIAEGRVSVNGAVLETPAVLVAPSDRVSVDGKPVDPPAQARLWMYHKPSGLVTSARDEKGRKTVFDALPEDMPRVMSVGRLDLNSEGLLLLTNDGGLKRHLELPSTGWLRRYRVRVHGRPSEKQLEPLRQGIEIEGERFQGMQVAIDRQQGANCWLTIGLREGKNREIRRAMESVELPVNRLIRISYGPFQLGNLPEGEVEPLKSRTLRDQLGAQLALEFLGPEQDGGTALRKPRPMSKHGAKPGFKGKRPSASDPGKSMRQKPGQKAYGKPSGKPYGKPSGKKPGKPG